MPQFASPVPAVAEAAATATPLGPGAKRVTFVVDGARVVGTLVLPSTYRDGERLPLVLVDGPWTQVKEQVGLVYARHLADAGLAAFAIDHRGWGESEGTRAHESATLKVADLAAAIGALTALPAIDAARIGVLGVCAGAGIVSRLAAEDARVRAVATTAAWLQHPSTTPLFYGGDEGVAARIALGDAARATFERTGVVETVAAYDPSAGSTAAMFFPVPYYAEATRGAIPQWRNAFAVMGWREWLTMDAIRHATDIRVPVLMVHSDGSALPDNVRRFFAELATPAADKALVWTTGEHTAFYDQAPQLQAALDALVPFFRRTLGVTAR
jgi:fermentation-respiration switch protein FrsA (DUF1100 family)